MRTADYSEREQLQAPQVPTHCRAEGCTNGTTFNGLCLYHSEAKNIASWPKITKLIGSHEFHYITWYINELMKWGLPTFVHVEGNTYFTEDLIINLQRRLVEFGISPEDVTYEKDSSPRGYAVKMKVLLLDHVLKTTGANKGEEGSGDPIPMPDWVMARIREGRKPRPKTYIKFTPISEVAKAIEPTRTYDDDEVIF